MLRPAPVRIARALAVGVVAHAAVQTAVAPAVAAQRVPPPPLNAAPAVGPYERARRLVEQGQGAVGRAVADSLVAASPPGSPALAEALWWRATLSADGARAEQDLRRIIDDFSASPRVGDATVRIAQLDISRDRPDMAVPALDRLVRERPDDPARAQAAYWLARARLEIGDVRGACFALADGATWVRSSETYTRQQLVELRERLPACDPQSVVSVMPGATRRSSGDAPARQVAEAPAAREPVSTPTSTPAPALTPLPRPPESHGAPPPATISVNAGAGVVTTVVPSTRSAAERIDSAEAAELRHRNAVAPTTSVAKVTPRTTPTAQPTATPTATSNPTPSTSASGATSATPPAVVPSAAPANASGNFAVQVAAYAQRAGAETLAAHLRTRGFDARATGQVAPFRVKIGRYATRGAAAAARATFAGQGLTGFVTDAGDGPPGSPPRQP